MTQRLFVRFAGEVVRTEDGFDAILDWLVRDSDGSVEAEGRTDLDGLAEVLESVAPWADDPHKVVVLVPAEDVLYASCQVPGRSAAQIRRAAPYAVEEFVADDIDTMQVACAPPVRNEPVRCLVAPRTKVDDWLACAAAAGLQPGFLTADAMALAAGEGEMVICFEGDSVLVRTAEQLARVDRPNIGYAVTALLNALPEGTPPPAIRVVGGTTADLDAAALDRGPVEEVPADRSMLAYLADEFDDGAVNLLQGAYTVRRRATGTWSQWRPVAVAASVLAGMVLVVVAAQGFWAGYQADRFRDEAVELYRALYNVERVAGNPAARMRRLLGQTDTSEAGFHQLAGQFGVGLANIPGRYELQGVGYSPRRGLDANVSVSDDAVLEGLGAALRRHGLEMDVMSTDASGPGGRINARLRVVPRS